MTNLINIQNRVNDLAFVCVSSEDLSKIVGELFINAVEAAKEKNSFTNIEFSLEKYGQNYELSVTDSANKLRSSNLEDYGNLFFTTKLDRPARGIGLYSVKNICRNLEWEFSLLSENNLTIARIKIPSSDLQFRKPETKLSA